VEVVEVVEAEEEMEADLSAVDRWRA